MTGNSDGPAAVELVRVSDDEPPAQPLVNVENIPLVVFDFDGTLAEQRGSWGLLYRLFGVEERGTARTEAFWDGELTFQEWCDGNVTDWRARGVTRDNLRRAAAAIKLTTGADTLLRALVDRPIPFGVLSSGVRELVSQVEEYGPAFIESNTIQYDGDVPIGVEATVGPFDKGEILRELCAARGVASEQVVYIGDSHSDTEAFEEAGTAILFDPDDRISEEDYTLVDGVVEDRDLGLVASLIDVQPV